MKRCSAVNMEVLKQLRKVYAKWLCLSSILRNDVNSDACFVCGSSRPTSSTVVVGAGRGNGRVGFRQTNRTIAEACISQWDTGQGCFPETRFAGVNTSKKPKSRCILRDAHDLPSWNMEADFDAHCTILQALCSKAREILVEECNVQRVDAPVTAMTSKLRKSKLSIQLVHSTNLICYKFSCIWFVHGCCKYPRFAGTSMASSTIWWSCSRQERVSSIADWLCFWVWSEISTGRGRLPRHELPFHGWLRW